MTKECLLRELKALFTYHPSSGRFRWKVKRNSYAGKAQRGQVAGSDKEGYVQIRVTLSDGRLHRFRAGRLAWFFMTGKFPRKPYEIDHKNGDRCDDRWSNLRIVTRSQNNMNHPIRTDNKSGHRGVSWRADIGKWHARIRVNGKIILLGNFIDPNEAAAARVAAEKEYFGAHSSLKRLQL